MCTLKKIKMKKISILTSKDDVRKARVALEEKTKKAFIEFDRIRKKIYGFFC